MGAISSALWTIAGAGKHIVADGTLYGCTFALLNHGMTRYGVEVSFVDTSDLDAVKAALKENTCAVYLETPANPNLKIADIAYVLETGRITMTGSGKELLENPEIKAAYLGKKK